MEEFSIIDYWPVFVFFACSLAFFLYQVKSLSAVKDKSS